jgi:tetratricopeptide (TPR) repeat protein
VQLPLALGLSLISCYSIKLPAFGTAQSANPETTNAIRANDGTVKQMAPNIAIANISLNENKQLVIEFDNPEQLSPSEPQVKDYPGQKHDIVLEFTQTSFAVDKAPKAKAVLEELSKVYPNLTAVAYATALDGTRARIRFGVASNVEAHPILVKVDKNAAIIDLNISQTDAAIASNDADSTPSEQTKTTPGEEPKVVAKATVPTSPTSTEEKSVKIKTVDGIKGAWTSSLKTGHSQVSKLGKLAKTNPLSKFGRGKSAEHLSVPANTDIVPTSTETVAQTKEETVTEKIPDTVATKNVSSLQPIETQNITTSTSDKVSLLRPEIVSPAEPATVTTIESTNAAPAANIASVTSSEITTPPGNIVSSAAAEAASAVTQAEPPKQEQITSIALNKTTVERIRTGLPRIPATTESKPAEEPMITPLSVEQVLKEKATLQAAVESKSAIPLAPIENNITSPPVAVEAQSDNTISSDLKTSFSKPTPEPVQETDKKEEAEKIASVPPNPLDNLTNAAINNAGTEAVEDKTASATTVKLRAQKAHVGGKDYLPPKFSDEAIEHYNAAVRAHLDGKLTEAITEYKEAIDADEKISEAYSNLGLIYNQLHKYDLAMVEFHKALALNSKDAITYNGIGAAMRAKNNLPAAIKIWQTAITIDPNLASAHYNLGTAYELNKDLDKALAQYKEAVKHDDKLGEAYYRMGLILQKMNNKNLALQEYKQAIKISQQASYVSDAKRRINLLSSQSKNQPM